ncbi:phosphoribosylformylglycinamidine synthase subunit PurL [Candidatus Micrarchaeota archaeon]|nr:phosphoribosylformylglycinamidine synthase subunit PurL [Candidatus Micrarchaeota archaeon]
MSNRIEVRIKEGFSDTPGEKIREKIFNELGFHIDKVNQTECYNLDADLSEDELEKLGREVFTDRIIQDYSFRKPFFENLWRIEVGFLPGVTDNVGKTAEEGIKDSLGKDIRVYYSKVYSLTVPGLNKEKCGKISELLYNGMVQRCIIHQPFDEVQPYIPKVVIAHEPRIDEIDLDVDRKALRKIVEQRMLALSIVEMNKIRKYIKRKKVQETRKMVGLGEMITDVELEALAQTWSEHCKHKIFNAYITYAENGESHAINSLFRTFIKGATDMVKKPFVVSVFKDNGGIIKFNENYDLAVKVETHNAPSALDPYGGALTGILGVNRDVMGTGLGAKPVANMDMLCFGYIGEKDIPSGVLSPKRIYEGVIKGIEDGGNMSGIPTVNGSITFNKCFTSRPLVYAGTVGLMPSKIGERNTSEKIIKPGYIAVMVGGRVGKDGIHGATFSSQQITENTPQSVVQIGDPFTQRKVLEFCIEARDKRLFEAITDNGAGGLSSSIGEMAQFSGGCKLFLEKAPLKYPGLDPWEILVSESQERMSIAVKPENLEEILDIAKKHDVEATVVGEFTDSGFFHVLYKGKTAAYLDMEFLHEGVPQMKLKAKWKRRSFDDPIISEPDLGKILLMLLKSPNISSKENIIRKYDHEVQAGSVIKPLVKGPNDAGVIRPVLDSKEGVVIAHGICPKYVQDSYDMAAVAFDEAVRNALAVGGKFGYLAALDNFSWPNPIAGTKNPDGEYKLAQLVRACLSLYDYSTSYGIPLISGKDSMKNDYYVGSEKYSILPTLLVTVVGKIDDVNKTLSSDFKFSGDVVYVLGKTKDELGGSDYHSLFGSAGDKNPKVNPDETIPLYKRFSEAVEEGLLCSAHDVSDGGLAVAIAECTIGGKLGVDADLGRIPRETEREDAILFSESAGRFVVSVKPEKTEEFEKFFQGIPFAKIGRIRGDRRFILRKDDYIMINEDVEVLKDAWSGCLP